MKWWELWLRTGIIISIVAGMITLWDITVSATTLLGNITAFIERYWLDFLEPAHDAFNHNTGVMPALVLPILMV